MYWHMSCTLNFNPHSREGSDRLTAISLAVRQDFNPHSREGSDQLHFQNTLVLLISIHTPAKGVTLMKQMNMRQEK